MSTRVVLIGFVVSVLGIGGCTPGPQPLNYGVHECDSCRMTLMDERYGGELVTNTGKIYTFDSVECLASYLESGEVPREKVHGAYVTDYGTPGQLIPASGRTSTGGSTMPVGRTICSMGVPPCSSSYGPGVAERKVISWVTDMNSSKFIGRLSSAEGRRKPCSTRVRLRA